MANRVYLEGNITRDTTVVATQGMPMAYLHLAADRDWEAGDGKARRSTLFSSVVCFGELAEYAARAEKGRRVIVEGALRLRERQNGDGPKRQELEIVADTMRLMEFRSHRLMSAAPMGERSRPASTRCRRFPNINWRRVSDGLRRQWA